MIYVSGYILHRILSRINVDTASKAFLCTAEEIFTFRAKVSPKISNDFQMLQYVSAFQILFYGYYLDNVRPVV